MCVALKYICEYVKDLLVFFFGVVHTCWVIDETRTTFFFFLWFFTVSFKFLLGVQGFFFFLGGGSLTWGLLAWLWLCVDVG